MNEKMNIRFSEDSSAMARFDKKNKSFEKKEILESIEQEMIPKGLIVNAEIQKQLMGDYIFYQFLYYDGKTSRDIVIQIPRTDMTSIQRMEQICNSILQKQPNIKKSHIGYLNKNALKKIVAGFVIVATTIGGAVIFLQQSEKETVAREEYVQSQIPSELKERMYQMEQEEIIFDEPSHKHSLS